MMSRYLVFLLMVTQVIGAQSGLDGEHVHEPEILKSELYELNRWGNGFLPMERVYMYFM